MQSDVWTEEEFALAVTAYNEMLDLERTGQPFDRADACRRLREGPLIKRSEANVEHQMQNISAVLALQGRPSLSTYPPAKNVGAQGIRIISALLEAMSEGEKEDDDASLARTGLPGQSRIFVTGMWGFNPGREGYVGFTHERTRDRLINIHQPGDLMLIVGQRGQYSAEVDVGRLLGIVELAPAPILEKDRLSEEAYQDKVKRFGADRWKYALPITRAWFMGREVKARLILPISYAHQYARSVGSSFRGLTPEETIRVLALPVTAAPVWGEPEWTAEQGKSRREETVSQAVSRGPAPWFGKTEVTRSDGETTLYLMKLSGSVDALFPRHSPSARQRSVVKVGRSNDPRRRVVELNCGFPPEANTRWELLQVQRFPTAREAHDAEQHLLQDLEGRQCSLGAEFAIIPAKEEATLLAKYAGASAFHIMI